MYSPARKVFGLHKLRCILSYSWLDAGVGNTFLDIFCVFAGMGGVSSTHVEKHLVFSLEWDWNGQHKLA